MSRIRKWICILSVIICLFPAMASPVEASESTEPYIQRLIQYYAYHQELAEEEIQILLAHISSIDPQQGALWETIMKDWDWCNREMPVYEAVLPDGLPEDDSLCIVDLGYGLIADGTMKQELISRLNVALRSAEKYPNAFLLLTGGDTAKRAKTTEAREMAQWLYGQGINPDRLILEKQSLNTAENAVNSCRILSVSYPMVDTIVIVSSDYHIPWGCAMFQTAVHCESAKTGWQVQVAANAANQTSKSNDTLSYQAWGISTIAGIPYADGGVPEI